MDQIQTTDTLQQEAVTETEKLSLMRSVAAVFGTNWQAQQRKLGASHSSLGMACAQ